MNKNEQKQWVQDNILIGKKENITAQKIIYILTEIIDSSTPIPAGSSTTKNYPYVLGLNENNETTKLLAGDLFNNSEFDNKHQLNSEQKVLKKDMPNNVISDRFTTNVGNGYAITSGYASEESDQFRQYSANFFLKSNNTFFNISAQPFAKEIRFTCGLMSWTGLNNAEGWQKLIAFTENDVPIHAPSFIVDSVKEVKKNICNCDKEALPLINELNIVTYDYKGDDTPNDMIGIIVDDDTTSDEFKDEAKTGVNLYKMLSIGMKGIQELSDKVLELNAKIEELKN